MILQKCQELVRQAWNRVRRELFGLWSSLSGVWMMMDKSKHLHQLCSQVDEALSKTVPQVRSSLLSSLSSVSVTQLSCGVATLCWVTVRERCVGQGWLAGTGPQ